MIFENANYLQYTTFTLKQTTAFKQLPKDGCFIFKESKT